MRPAPTSSSSLIRHVERSIASAERDLSKLSAEIASLPGMSGQHTRHFLNCLLEVEGWRYLEVGTWQGSTLCSALYRNPISALGIDNWSLFGGPREECLENVRTLAPDSNVRFLEQDCFDVDVPSLGTFDVYFFDGPHTEDDQRRAITEYYGALADLSVIIVDDWNWEAVRKGTRAGLREVNAPIVYEREIRLTDDDSHTPADQASATWHNGIYLCVIDRTLSPTGRMIKRLRTKFRRPLGIMEPSAR